MLGLQTNGSYPQHLKYDDLLPTLDLLPWYLESRAEIQSVIPAAISSLGAGAFQAIWTVPTQEVWVLLACTLQPTFPWAAGPSEIQICRARANDSLSRIALSDPVSITATRYPLCYSSPAVRGLVLRPTVQIGVQAVTATPAASFVNGCLRFVRCQI
jgi:hypothetical protein